MRAPRTKFGYRKSQIGINLKVQAVKFKNESEQIL